MEANSDRQWSTVLNQWQRLKSMDISRINYTVFEWCERNGNQLCKNWNFQINTMLKDADISLDNTPNLGVIKDQVAVFLFSKFKTSWLAEINRQDARNGNGGNKLRTYRLFKQEFKSEPYLTCPMSKSHRSAYAKFRSERYERLDYSDRTCYNCAGEVESEIHVLLYCPVYQTLREDMLATLTSEFSNIVTMFLT